jgi:hypothetical protein
MDAATGSGHDTGFLERGLKEPGNGPPRAARQRRQRELTSQGLALDIPLAAPPRPRLVDCICLARSARLGPLCGAATSTKFAFGTA